MRDWIRETDFEIDWLVAQEIVPELNTPAVVIETAETAQEIGFVVEIQVSRDYGVVVVLGTDLIETGLETGFVVEIQVMV